VHAMMIPTVTSGRVVVGLSSWSGITT
jgi:hypothetical protein